MYDGDTFSVDRTYLRSPPTPFSAPRPHGRRMFTVSLLPSGPGPFPATAGRRPLRGFDPCPPTSWDEVSTKEDNGLPQAAPAFLKLRPPHTDGFR